MKLTQKILVLIAFIAGISLNAKSQDVQSQAIKYGRVLRLVENFYVDSAALDKLTENAIVEVLSKLDPHSVYISREEVEEMNQPLQGNFEGIGISFNIHNDTLMVLTTIPGGPSEKVGLRPSDRIMVVDGKDIAGIGLKNQDVFDMLRGNKGTVVKLKIKRKGESELLDFTIIRDKIPIYSLDASYMLNKETAYIKLNRFGATTIAEYEQALESLRANNRVENLILDLRGNGGGYLKAAIDLADNFLGDRHLVVYTEGLHSPKREYHSTPKGTFEEGKLIILIDEGSASASEIVAGAIQDWDRGVLIGRRSFGKGLVQQPFMLNDGSMLRLTTAHYYTPAGRSIQKSYENGVDDYRMDYFSRFEKGEFFNQDSIHFSEKLTANTLVKGRKVYGGGGIMPDIFVPMDTSAHYRYFNILIRNNVLFPYVVSYIDANRTTLEKRYKAFEAFRTSFRVTDIMLEELYTLGEKEGVEKDVESLDVSGVVIRRQIKALIARDLFERGVYYQIMNEDDDVIERALEIIMNGKKYNAYLSN